jgi:hypothetical protein
MLTFAQGGYMNRFDIFEEAKRLTATDRQDKYGTPYNNHRRIANLWSAYLDQEITPEQVAIMMVLMKVARSMQEHHEDNYVDGAAYFAIAGELAAIKNRQDKQ